MRIIAAVSVDGAIGEDNNLLWHISEDFKRYKSKTTGNILIVGRKTYESLPLIALQNRTHIVITSNKTQINIPNDYDIHITDSIEEAIAKTEKIKTINQEIYVIGGSQLYEKMIDFCDVLEITWINKIYNNANKYFPIEKIMTNFKLVNGEDWMKSTKGLLYKFNTYSKNKIWEKLTNSH